MGVFRTIINRFEKLFGLSHAKKILLAGVILSAGLLMVPSVSVGQKLDWGAAGNDADVQHEMKAIKHLKKLFEEYQRDYASIRNMNFDRLEARTKRFAVAFNRARNSGASPEKLRELRLQYYKALHFEWSQKVYTYESASALTWKSLKDEYVLLLYEDIAYICDNIKISDVFPCLKKDGLPEECLSFSSMIQSTVQSMLVGTWKLKYVQYIQRELGVPRITAEWIWDEYISPQVENFPGKVLAKEGANYLQEKGEKKIIEQAKKRLKKELPATVKKAVAKSGKTLEKVVEEAAEKRAKNLIGTLAFGSDLFWEGIKLYLNQKTFEQIKPTLKKRLEIARMAAAPNRSDQRVDYFFRYPDKAFEVLRKKKISIRKIPGIDPNAPETTLSGHIIKLDGIKKKEKPKITQGEEPDFTKLIGLLSSARSDFIGGRLYYADYLEIIKNVESVVKKAIDRFRYLYPSATMDKARLEKQRRFFAFTKRLKEEVYQKFITATGRITESRKRRQKAEEETQRKITTLSELIQKELSKADRCVQRGDAQCFLSSRDAVERDISGVIEAKRECDDALRNSFDEIKGVVTDTPALFYRTGILKRGGTLTIDSGDGSIRHYAVSLHRREIFYIAGRTKRDNLECRLSSGLSILNSGVELTRLSELLSNRIAQIVIGEKEPDWTLEGLTPKKPGRTELDFIRGTVYENAIQDNFQELLHRHTVASETVRVGKKTLRKASKTIYEAKERFKKHLWNLVSLEIKYRRGDLAKGAFLSSWAREVEAMDREIKEIKTTADFAEIYDPLLKARDKYSKEQKRLHRILSIYPKKISKIPEADFSGLERVKKEVRGEIESFENMWKDKQTKDSFVQRLDSTANQWIWERLSPEERTVLQTMLQWTRRQKLGSTHLGYSLRPLEGEFTGWVLDLSKSNALKKGLMKLGREIVSAYERNERVLKEVCSKAAGLRDLMRSLNVTYDSSKYKKASGIYRWIREGRKDLYAYREGLLKREILPNLRIPCSAKMFLDALKAYENYVPPQNRPMPEKIFSEVLVNTTRLDSLSGQPVHLTTAKPRVKITVEGITPQVRNVIADVGVKVCALPLLSTPKTYREWEKRCDAKPYVQTRPRGGSYETDLSVQWRNPYRVFVQITMKDKRQAEYEAGDFTVDPKQIRHGDDEKTQKGQNGNGSNRKGNSDNANHSEKWPSCNLFAAGHGKSIVGVPVGGSLILYAQVKHEPEIPIVHSSWSWIETKSGKSFEDNRIGFDFSTPEIDKLQRQGKPAVKVSFYVPGSYTVLHYGSDQVGREFKCDYRITVRKTAENRGNGVGNPHTEKKRKREKESLRGETGKNRHEANTHRENAGETRDANRCKAYYRKYVNEYNRVTKLMSSGRGDTDEAREAYRAYQRSRQRYLACKKKAVPSSLKPPAHAKSRKKTDTKAVYLGCYKDSGDPFSIKGRDLHGYGYMSRNLTPDACFLTCARKGFRYAGLQYSRSCVCGNRYGKYGKADNCNMPCTGDKSKICGGSWANSVYNVSGIRARAISHQGMELNTDRPGGDYKNVELPYPDPNLCRQACERDPRCKSWTYQEPRPDASDFTECWLKNTVPDTVSHKRRISGIKTVRSVSGGQELRRFDHPRLEDYRLDWCYRWASGCGEEAANAFCRAQGFDRAARWEEDVDIGDRTPTKIIGTGQVCAQHACDGFRFIECVNRKSVRSGSHPGSERSNAGNTRDEHGGYGIGIGGNPGGLANGRGGFANGLVNDRYIRFHDDFDRFDPSKWEVYEWKTLRHLDGAGLVRNGVLDLRCDRTDRSPFVVSKPIPLKKGEIFIFRRRVKVHYANRYFEGGIRFYQTDGSAVRMPANRAAWLSAFGKYLFGVNYYNYVYEKPGVRQYVPTRYGFALSGYDWRRRHNYGVLEPIWDRWFEEEIVFDPGAGTVTYRIDGRVVGVHSIPFSGPYLSFVMHSYGWYTGHDVQVDWVDWSVQPEFIREGERGVTLVDTADMLSHERGARSSGSSSGAQERKERVLIDTADMLKGDTDSESSGHSRISTTQRSYSSLKSKGCQTSFRRYIAAYDRLTRGIGDASVSDLRLIRLLHAYRKEREAYAQCTGHMPRSPQAPSSKANSNRGRCEREYTQYQNQFAQLNTRMQTQDDLSFIRLRKRYLKSKKAYEECLRQKSAETIVKRPPTPSHSTPKEHTVVYAGSILTNVVVAMRKLPSGEPDADTVTDHLSDGRKPFYLFVYYQGAKPTDRFGIKWYLRKPGSKEEILLFEENGGKLPKAEGVLSARIAIEGGGFPPGEYHLIFTVNGKKAIEKFFTIGKVG